jgi:hypothetical protein
MSDWADLGKARKKADRTYKNTGSIKSRFSAANVGDLRPCVHQLSVGQYERTHGDPFGQRVKSRLRSGSENSAGDQRFVPNVAAFEQWCLRLVRIH